MKANEFLRGKAGAQTAEVRETADKKTCAYQEQKRKSDLRDDKAFSQAMMATAAHDGSGLIF